MLDDADFDSDDFDCSVVFAELFDEDFAASVESALADIKAKAKEGVETC